MVQPRNFSLQGAVDLGARQTAAKRRQQAPPGDGQPEGVIEVTDETFTAEVIERSRQVPVILDLWADWCQPCKQLSPILEKLAAEAAGAWILAKVDVDASPQLSAALQVQSIPTVVAVIAGQAVDGFVGVLPEQHVRQWLDRVQQAAAQLGLPGVGAPDGTAPADGQPAGAAAGAAASVPAAQGPPPMRPAEPAELADPAFADAQDAMERGDLDGAAAAFNKVLAAQPGHPMAAMGLAQVDLIRRVNSYDQARAMRAASEHPDDPQAQARAADLDLVAGKIEAAFDRLLDTIRRTSGDDRNAARLHLLELFAIFPPRDPRVAKARATLSSLLF